MCLPSRFRCLFLPAIGCLFKDGNRRWLCWLLTVIDKGVWEYGFLLGTCTAPMVWSVVFSGFRSICVLTVIGSLFDSNSFLSTGCFLFRLDQILSDPLQRQPSYFKVYDVSSCCGPGQCSSLHSRLRFAVGWIFRLNSRLHCGYLHVLFLCWMVLAMTIFALWSRWTMATCSATIVYRSHNNYKAQFDQLLLFTIVIFDNCCISYISFALQFPQVHYSKGTILHFPGESQDTELYRSMAGCNFCCHEIDPVGAGLVLAQTLTYFAPYIPC